MSSANQTNNKFNYLQNESQQIQKTNPYKLNSVSNDLKNMAMLYYVPEEWGESEIKKYFDPQSNQISKVKMVQNRIGTKKGQALIEFINQEFCDAFVSKWHENFIETNSVLQKVATKTFDLKTNQSKIDIKRDNKQVFVYNLAYQTKGIDLYAIASDFGPIENIDIPTKNNGAVNKGYAFINFKNPQDALNFIEFYDQKEFMGRNIRIQIKTLKFDTQKPRYQKKSDYILSSHDEDIKNSLKKENNQLYKDLLIDNKLL